MDISKLMAFLQILGAIAVGLPALISALIAFFMLIPGAQPEKFLQEKFLPIIESIVGFIAKFSKK